MTVDQLTHIPIVDLSEYRSGTSEQRQYIARDLAHACCVVGFVYIAGHGIPAELQQDAFTWSKKLFDLKHEDKMKAPHPSGPSVHRGYSHPGFEKVSQETGDDDEQGSRAKALRQIADYKESYEIGSEENAAQPNIWLPEQTLPGFRAFMTKFYWEFHKTARLVLQVLAQGIDLAEEDTTHFIQLHSGQNNQLRLLHYPPVPAAEVESQAVARMPAHSDWR
ncbi:MAG: hypothetical protein M1830_007330 [Pleopsidium flavum]|nr:MAG: hypothetical protein M1830_007330 [Pleopsidium flavum]